MNPDTKEYLYRELGYVLELMEGGGIAEATNLLEHVIRKIQYNELP